MAVRERSNSVGSDKNGQRVGTRVYRVDGVAPPALIANPAAYGLPVIGSTWEGLIADSITITTPSDPTTAYDAEVLYSNGGQFTFPKKLDEDLDSWSGSTYTEPVELPFFKRVGHSIATTPGNPPQIVYGWDGGTRSITERRERVVRSVSVPETLLQDAVEAIRSQTQKRHVFYGREYLFAGGTYSLRRNGVYQFDYTWEWDGGTPFNFNIDRDRVVLPGPFKEDGTPFVGTPDPERTYYYRPPYSFVAPAKDAPDNTQFICIFEALRNSNGYQQLVNVGIP